MMYQDLGDGRVAVFASKAGEPTPSRLVPQPRRQRGGHRRDRHRHPPPPGPHRHRRRTRTHLGRAEARLPRVRRLRGQDRSRDSRRHPRANLTRFASDRCQSLPMPRPSPVALGICSGGAPGAATVPGRSPGPGAASGSRSSGGSRRSDRRPAVAELLGDCEDLQPEPIEGIIVDQGGVLLCESLDGQAKGCAALPSAAVDVRARADVSALLGERISRPVPRSSTFGTPVRTFPSARAS